MQRLARLALPLLLAALIAAVPTAAEAARRRLTIRPNALSPATTQQSDMRLGVFNTSSGDAFFWKDLRLPRGSRIRSLRYRRMAATTGPTVVTLDRVNPDHSPAWEQLFVSTSTGITPAGAPSTLETAVRTGTSRLVRPAWTYFVLVTTSTPTAAVGDIIVTYDTP